MADTTAATAAAPPAQAGRQLHPAYKVVEDVESMWARDRSQQWQRTMMIVRALGEAGHLGDGELIGGKFYCRSANEGTNTASK